MDALLCSGTMFHLMNGTHDSQLTAPKERCRCVLGFPLRFAARRNEDHPSPGSIMSQTTPIAVAPSRAASGSPSSSPGVEGGLGNDKGSLRDDLGGLRNDGGRLRYDEGELRNDDTTTENTSERHAPGEQTRTDGRTPKQPPRVLGVSSLPCSRRSLSCRRPPGDRSTSCYFQ